MSGAYKIMLIFRLPGFRISMPWVPTPSAAAEGRNIAPQWDDACCAHLRLEKYAS